VEGVSGAGFVFLDDLIQERGGTMHSERTTQESVKRMDHPSSDDALSTWMLSGLTPTMIER